MIERALAKRHSRQGLLHVGRTLPAPAPRTPAARPAAGAGWPTPSPPAAAGPPRVRPRFSCLHEPPPQLQINMCGLRTLTPHSSLPSGFFCLHKEPVGVVGERALSEPVNAAAPPQYPAIAAALCQRAASRERAKVFAPCANRVHRRERQRTKQI